MRTTAALFLALSALSFAAACGDDRGSSSADDGATDLDTGEDSAADADADADVDTDADVDADAEDDGAEAACSDGERRCTGELSETCAGGTWGAGVDCTTTGEVCDPGTGACVDPCARATTGALLGCEFWAVDLDSSENSVDTAAAGQFAVVVVNPGANPVEVVVDRDLAAPGDAPAADEVARVTVPSGESGTLLLPRWDVDGDGTTAGSDDDPQTTLSRRVYHITAGAPVAAYAFQPLPPLGANGAWPLRPTTTLGTDHFAVVWPPANPIPMPSILPFPNRDYVTIVGVEDATTVWVTPTFDIFEGVGQAGSNILAVPAILAGERTEFLLDRSDVLNLETRGNATPADPLPDLTGTRVESDGPVVVLTGVDLATVGGRTLPDGSTDGCCGEFMGAQVPPVAALRDRFVVARSPTRSSNPAAWLEYDEYRVLATADGTTVTTTLTEPGLDSFTLDAGQWSAFSSRDGFVLESSPGPVLVAQYLAGRGQVYRARAAASGDPDLVYVPPVEEWGTRYLFPTVDGYAETWAAITMADGASATIDGEDVATTCTAGFPAGELDGVAYRSYHCALIGLVHEALATGASPEPFGVMVFGYGITVSYQFAAVPVPLGS